MMKLFNTSVTNRFNTVLASTVLVSLLSNMVAPMALAQSVPSLESLSSANQVKGKISINRDVNATSNTKTADLNLRDADIKDVLNMLAQQGNFNLIVDSSVTGTITVDVKNISINKALEYIFTVSGLSYAKDGNTLIVSTSAGAKSKGITTQTFKSIPVLYKSAEDLADQLGDTVFKAERPGGNTDAVVSFDGDSNSILVMGTEADVRLAAQAVRELDIPRNRKVYQIRHSTPAYVASVIAQNFFTPSGETGSAAASSDISNGSGKTAGAIGTTSVIEAGGVKMIAESLSATLTVQGTEEQISLVDSIIDQVDIRRPQVVIEFALVEASSTDIKRWIPDFGQMSFGEFRLNTVDLLSSDNILSWNNTNSHNTAGSIIPFTTFSASHRFTNSKVKILANPTITVLDGQTATFNTTDQVPQITETVTVPAAGAPIVTTTISGLTVGVQMTVTPQVYEDGSIVMNMTPNITSPGLTVSAGGGSLAEATMLSTRTVTINGVRIKDAQTLVISGLNSNRETMNTRKVPVLGDLPLVGGLFKANGVTGTGDQRNKTEVVMLVTPHIIKEDAVSYFNNPPSNSSNFANPNRGEVKPVSLPKFIGNSDVSSKSGATQKMANILPWMKKDKAAKPDMAASLQPKGDIELAEPNSFEQSDSVRMTVPNKNSQSDTGSQPASKKSQASQTQWESMDIPPKSQTNTRLEP